MGGDRRCIVEDLGMTITLGSWILPLAVTFLALAASYALMPPLLHYTIRWFAYWAL